MDAFDGSEDVIDLAMDPMANPFAPVPGGPAGKLGGGEARLPAEPVGAITQWDPWHNPVGGDNPGDQDGPGTPFEEEDESVETGDEIVPGLEFLLEDDGKVYYQTTTPGWFDEDGDGLYDRYIERRHAGGDVDFEHNTDGKAFEYLVTFRPFLIF